jgi:hypothetical protein
MTAALSYLPKGGRMFQKSRGMLAKSVLNPAGTTISILNFLGEFVVIP